MVRKIVKFIIAYPNTKPIVDILDFFKEGNRERILLMMSTNRGDGLMDKTAALALCLSGSIAGPHP